LQSPMPSRNITRLSINSPFNYIYFALGDSYADIPPFNPSLNSSTLIPNLDSDCILH
jgi:hypothetical protein